MATLLYDGGCGYCKRWASWAEARGAPIRFTPCQEAGPGLGLSEQDCLDAAWFINGDRRKGARAVAAVWKRLPGARNLGWRLLGHVTDAPILRLGSAAGYRWVARNRHRLRGPA